MAWGRVTARRKLVRQEMILTGCKPNIKALADHHGVKIGTIYTDIIAIHNQDPPPSVEFDEAAAIKAHFATIESNSLRLEAELEENEIQIEAYGDSPGVVGFLNIRVNLLSQTRQNQKDLRDFHFATGYIKESAKAFTLETPLSTMSDDDIDGEITKITGQLALIKGPLDAENNTAGPAVDEAEALPLPAQEDDNVQGE